MRWLLVAAALAGMFLGIGIIWLFVWFMAGCSNLLETTEEPNWNSCSRWQVCDVPEKTSYNITSSDCLLLDSSNAQALWGLLMKHNIKMSATCQGEVLTIRQVG